jgi:hypothetical protein
MEVFSVNKWEKKQADIVIGKYLKILNFFIITHLMFNRRALANIPSN